MSKTTPAGKLERQDTLASAVVRNGFQVSAVQVVHAVCHEHDPTRCRQACRCADSGGSDRGDDEDGSGDGEP